MTESEARVLAILKAEWRYWLEAPERVNCSDYQREIWHLAMIIGSGALSNVLAAIALGTSAEDFEKQILERRN